MDSDVFYLLIQNVMRTIPFCTYMTLITNAYTHVLHCLQVCVAIHDISVWGCV